MKKIILLLLVFTAVSCGRDEFLDFVPPGVKIPETTADFRQLLDQVGEASSGQSLSNGFGRTQLRSYFFTDDAALSSDIANVRNYNREVTRTFRFEENHFTSNEDDGDWANYYNQIYTSNIILDGLSQLDGSDPEVAELIGEAKIHRAWAYLNLVNMYALHYNPSTASSNLGVPIRDGLELADVDLTRASVERTYEYIIDDITSSINALPDVQLRAFRFRPSKAAAHALLSRVYLYQGEYQNALNHADDALDLYSELNDFNTILSNSAGSNTLIMPELIGDDNEVVLYKFFDFFTADALFITDELLNLYEDGDLRKLWYGPWTDIVPDQDFGTTFFSYWVSNYPNSGIGTSELLLTSAECNARLNNTGPANMRLNQLRLFRLTPDSYVDLNITDPAELLQFVKDERRRELVPFHVRLFDIKRYNEFDGDNISITHDMDGETFSLPANSNNWAFPIAQKYIQINPEIIQNPRD